MGDPVEYLKEAHRRAERLAEAATPGPWLVDSSTYAEAIYSAGNTDVVAGGRWGGEASVFESTEDALHIAANAPDKVMARVEAERAILRLHWDGWETDDPDQDAKEPYLCGVCGYGWPCQTVRLLAAGWGWTE